nr:hypothetical protein [Lachnospiraceae bacterium]
MKAETITWQDLRSKNPININDYNGKLSSYTFWNYTSLHCADLILKNKCFQVRNISAMNDLDEKQLHQEDCEMVHALCFCNSNTEKIPMWYLYSGITGEGIAIGLTQSVMIEFIKTIEKVRSLDGREFSIGKDKEIEILFGWVYYQKKEQPKQVFYRNKLYEIDSPTEFIKKNYFVKIYPWEYEREFRILFKNNTKEILEKVVIDIPDQIYKKLKLKLAPEITEEMTSEIVNTEGFKEYFKSQIQYSELQIKMGLLDRNRESIKHYLDEIITNNDPEDKLLSFIKDKLRAVEQKN